MDEHAGGDETIVDQWLEPLDGEPCGEDLEYDNEFLELTQAAAGKPETQFAPAEPPDWRRVQTLAESLFGRTRDLRVAIHWARARVAAEGWTSLPDGLRLVHGLLERFWDGLHPRPDPDDGDPYARLNALEAMGSVDGLLGDLRQAPIARNRAFGDLRGRDIEVALERLEPRADETPTGRTEIERMLADAAAEEPALSALPDQAVGRLDAITGLLRERVDFDRAPAFDALRSMLADLSQLLPSETETLPEVEAGEEPSPRRALRTAGRASGEGIETRDDALRAIDLVCDFLERTEPTNPAQLLLRRAQRLVNKNFLELVHELAPDALAEVARVMGVPPESISGESGERGES